MFREDELDRMCENRGTHWCLRGPSGTGKTHVAKSFARRQGWRFAMHNASEEVTDACVREVRKSAMRSQYVWIVDEANMLTPRVVDALHDLMTIPLLTVVLVCNENNFRESLLSRLEEMEFSPYTEETAEIVNDLLVMQSLSSYHGPTRGFASLALAPELPACGVAAGFKWRPPCLTTPPHLPP